ncbi:hypothetical protein Tco_0547356, partial [Tanacetum coccineum]
MRCLGWIFLNTCLLTEGILTSKYYEKYVKMAEKKKKAQKVDETKEAGKSKKSKAAKKLILAKKPTPTKKLAP